MIEIQLEESSSATGRVRRNRARTRLAALLSAAAVLALVAGGLAIVRASGASMSSVTTRGVAGAPAGVPLPADCVPTPHPPPTEYGFVALVTNGTVTGPAVSVTGLDLSICGVLTIVNPAPGSHCATVQAQLRIPGDGVVTSGIDTRLTVVPKMRPKLPVQLHVVPLRQGIDCVDSSHGFTINLAMTMQVGAGAFGLQCRIPLSGTLTTTVSGHLLTPPFHSDQTMTGTFSAGTVVNDDRYCPGNLPASVNRIAGLPAGGYRAMLPTRLAVYQHS